MGGQAFRHHSPPLTTPRMPEDVYLLVKNQTRNSLLQHFTHVENALESPGKVDYGDVDFLVHGPKSPSFDPITNRLSAAQNLSSLLSARAHVSQNGNPTLNFAIPYPNTNDEKYIQVDIHYLPTLAQFCWELFHSAHGDLWNMLGSTIRPFGLTVNDVGMFLRIPEIELADKKKAMVFLSSEPRAILDFMGLEEETWWKRFGSVDDMFIYAAGSRFFWVKSGNVENRKPNDKEAEAEGGEGKKEDLKRSDRKRVLQRPIFSRWIEEFIPSCRTSGKYSNITQLTRAEIRDEAFEKFGVRKVYEDRLREWNLGKHKDELWRVAIKGNIPEVGVDPQVRGAAGRVFKELLIENQFVEGMAVPKGMKMQEEGFWDLEAVAAWVSNTWEEAGKIGMGMNLKSVQKQRNKEAN